MTPVSKRSQIFDIGRVSTDEEIDFLRHRSGCYVTMMTLGVARQLAKLATR
uniref:Uncharacterized protein n=1 Tax=Ciona savignyi TaxID=51511 RepID=H2Z187_CIOSA